MAIHVFDQAGSVLGRSGFVDKFYGCPEPLVSDPRQEVNVSLLEHLESMNYDFYIFASDAIPTAIKNSPLSEDLKRAILPVGDPK